LRQKLFLFAERIEPAQLLEAKTNLQRLKQEIPLIEAECAAVEDGLEAVEGLCARLADILTPAGQRRMDWAPRRAIHRR
jgi:hypothetical protein